MTITAGQLRLLARTNSPHLQDAFHTFVDTTSDLVRELDHLPGSLFVFRSSAFDDLGLTSDLATNLDIASDLVTNLVTNLHLLLASGQEFETETILKQALRHADDLELELIHARQLNLVIASDLARAEAQALIRDLETAREREFFRSLDERDNRTLPALDVLVSVASIVYVRLGVPYSFEGSHLVRPALLTQHETVEYVGSFEAAFSGVVNAEQDGLIDPDHFESIRNIMQQIQLVRARPSAKTQQLELLIAEMLEILNGSIQDEQQFRDEFLRLDVDADTAAIAAHELVRAIELATEHLGTDDPAESGEAMQDIAAVDERLTDIEEPLRKKIAEKAALTATTAVTTAAANAAVRLYGDDFMMIAREFVSGLARVFRSLFT